MASLLIVLKMLQKTGIVPREYKPHTVTVRVGTDAHADRPQRAFWKGLMCAMVPTRTVTEDTMKCE